MRLWGTERRVIVLKGKWRKSNGLNALVFNVNGVEYIGFILDLKDYFLYWVSVDSEDSTSQYIDIKCVSSQKKGSIKRLIKNRVTKQLTGLILKDISEYSRRKYEDSGK